MVVKQDDIGGKHVVSVYENESLVYVEDLYSYLHTEKHIHPDLSAFISLSSCNYSAEIYFRW